MICQMEVTKPGTFAPLKPFNIVYILGYVASNRGREFRAGLHDQLGRLQGHSVSGRHHHPLRRGSQRQRHCAAPLSGTRCRTVELLI